MLPYGIAAWPAGILGTAALRFDVFLLAHYAGTTAVGIYSIAVTFAELCMYVPGALSGVLIPKVASGEQGGLEVTLRVARVLWIVTAGVAVLVLVVAAPLIPLIFGSEFSASVLPLVCILPGVVFTAMSSSAAAYLAGVGRPVDVTRAAGLNVVVNIAANVVLAPRLGAVGAALASTLSYGAAAAMLVFLFRRQTHSRLSRLLLPGREDFLDLYQGARRALRREG
jgi:O-antigen/teichoic acid export membrane protein